MRSPLRAISNDVDFGREVVASVSLLANALQAPPCPTIVLPLAGRR
jgi:hypothetical protein